VQLALSDEYINEHRKILKSRGPLKTPVEQDEVNDVIFINTCRSAVKFKFSSTIAFWGNGALKVLISTWLAEQFSMEVSMAIIQEVSTDTISVITLIS